jgi:magnesium chelatase family protein
MDRVDLWMNVEHIDYKKLGDKENLSESSETIRARIAQARHLQEIRFGTRLIQNAHMHARDIAKIILSPETKQVLEECSTVFKLSPRGYHRIIKIAQTIADLALSETILPDHILEAFQYRSRQ